MISIVFELRSELSAKPRVREKREVSEGFYLSISAAVAPLYMCACMCVCVCVHTSVCAKA